MGTTTTNLSLYKPESEESGYAANVNSNFDLIDAQLFAKNVTTVSSGTHNLAATDEIILVDISTNNVTIQLPTASSREGQIIIVKVIEYGEGPNVYVMPYGTETIEGGTLEYEASGSNYDYITLVCDGSDGWWIIGNSGFSQAI